MKKDKNKNNDSLGALSEEELAMLKASREGEIDRSTLPPHDTSDMAEAKRYIKKNKFSVMLAAFIMVILAVVIGILVFLLVKTLAARPSTDDFTVMLGNDKEYTVDYDEAMIDGVFYLDMVPIASYAEIVESGTDTSRKFTCGKNDKTYVRFEDGKDTATVNGVRVKLEGTAKITKSKKTGEYSCLVPFSFIEKLFSNPTVNGDTPGVRTAFNKKTNEVKIGRLQYKDGTYLPISFSENCFDIAESDVLMAYKRLYPSLPSVCEKQTMLVNKNNPLGESYTPKGLFSLNSLDCPVVEDGDYRLCSAAAYALSAMMKAMEKDLGQQSSVLVTSAYRSYSYQDSLFNLYVKELMEKGYTRVQAETEVSKTSAQAGYSEHQSGLCVDLIENGKLELSESFENTAAFSWLRANAHKYGFILRYPKDKTAVTGYSYEPWHYRFVGVDAATVIYQDNICLEEYLAKF